MMTSLFPANISPTGGEIDRLFWLAAYLTGAAFLLVLGILVYFLIRYRSRPAHKAFYTHGTSRRALFLTLGLALSVFLLIDVNLAFHDHKAWKVIWRRPDHSNPLRVQIMPEQFAWNIRYPGSDAEFNTDDDIVTMNQLHIPANRPVIVQLKSKDVIHSFFLPNFRIKQDAVPGLVTSLSFEANQTGDFEIACAEHCGLGHYRMKGFLRVETEQELQAWLDDQWKEKDNDPKWGWNWSN